MDELALPSSLRNANLPTLPLVAVEVLRLCRDDATTLDDLARCIAQDPSLAARLLRFANSSLYDLGSEVTTLQRASLVLGMKTVQMMALSFSLASGLPRGDGSKPLDYPEYWRRSLIRAVAARTLARGATVPVEDEAFLGGLLAEIGQLALSEGLPDAYRPVCAAAAGWPTPEAELAALGFDHVTAGAALLAAWGLPVQIHAAVRFAPAPEALPSGAPPAVRSVVEVVHVASRMVDLLTAPCAETLARLEEAAGRYADLQPGAVHRLVVRLSEGVREISELLSLRLPPGRDHAELLAEAARERARLARRPEHGPGRGRDAEAFEHRRSLRADPRWSDRPSGLPDRRGLEAFLALEIGLRSAGRAAGPLGLLLVEVEGLAQVAASRADEALRAVADALGELAGDEDLPARLEGPRFGVVLVEGSPPGLRALAERARVRCAERLRAVLPAGQEPVVLVGGAVLREASGRADGGALHEAARACLERARAGGGRRSETHPVFVDPRR